MLDARVSREFLHQLGVLAYLEETTIFTRARGVKMDSAGTVALGEERRGLACGHRPGEVVALALAAAEVH